MIQIILSRESWRLLGDIMASHVSTAAVLALLKKGSMDKDDALQRISDEVVKSAELWEEWKKESV